MKELSPQIIDVLKYKPARYMIERYVVYQFICPTCTDENLEAEIVFNRYVSGTPIISLGTGTET